VFVAGIGTGGTVMGVGRMLRETLPQVKVAALHVQVQSMIQGLMSLDQFVPPILDLDMLDVKVPVSDEEAFAAARELAADHGLFVGLSSGAVYAAARKLAAQGFRRIVGVFGDSGAKYLSTAAFAGIQCTCCRRQD